MSVDRTEATDPDDSATQPSIVGDVVFGGADSPVAVCTLGSRALLAELAGRPEIFVAGRVFTENIGVEKMVENLAALPSIRYLIVCGRETQHLVGQTILALHRHGLDADRRVVGSTAPEPILPNLDPRHLATFQSHLAVLDMVGIVEVQAIVEAARRLTQDGPPERSPERATGTAMAHNAPAEVETVAARRDPANAWQYDPAGYFVVVLDRERGLLRAEQYTPEHQHVRSVEGRAAEEICHTIGRMQLVTLLPHALYLGRELAKAETALALDLPYEQDRPLISGARHASSGTHEQPVEELRGDGSGDSSPS
ncbi:MAG: DUF4346 domain-containing protein [Chloroflexota bacterium]